MNLSLFATAASFVLPAGEAVAATGGTGNEGIGLLGGIFMAFTALVVMFQVLPGMTLFVRSLREIFGRAERRAKAENTDRNGG